MSDANKRLVRRMFDEAINGRDLSVFDEIVAEDYVDHDPYNPPDLPQGREGLKQLAGGYFAAFPDLKMTIEDQIAEGDRVVTRWTVRGTHGGDLMGIAPTGRQVTVSGVFIDRIADGLIAESWAAWDAMGMLQQVGAIPEPAQA